MTPRPRALLGLAALAGLTSVAFGAFAAHGVADSQAQAWLKTGSTYQMSHALAIWAATAALPEERGVRMAGWAFLVGGAIFAGTLYAMALGAPRWLGAVTPLGGLTMMAGWVLLAWTAGRSPDKLR